MIDLLGDQSAEYETAQAVVGYWRSGIEGTTEVLDQHVDYYYKTEQMNEVDMGARFDFNTLAADSNLKNRVFDAVDTHADWLRLQTSIYEVTRKINDRLAMRQT